MQFISFRWTKTNPMATKDLIVVPVHENMVHWCVLAVHVPSKTIFYLDRFVFFLKMCMHLNSKVYQ